MTTLRIFLVLFWMGLLETSQGSNSSSSAGLKCYTCDRQFHYNCNLETHVTTCIPVVHDTCQSVAIKFEKGTRFEKKCTRKESCDVVTKEWLTHGLCTRRTGSMCVHCCQTDKCNMADPIDLFGGADTLRSIFSFVLPFMVTLIMWRLV